ncbi:S41 family peptidase [Maribacter sp. 2307UL18-2]|uniref:S41 family peptidase n=1 Tax=Maribacter sp. 2307UL18-2 TaxID=3386274 RepID=UPI0039BC72EB
MNLNRLYPLVFVFSLFTMSNALLAQNEIEKVVPIIEKKLLLEDLEILKSNLEKAQPGLYNYKTKTDVDVFFEQVKNGITHDMNSIDFFRLIAPLSSLIKNGHSILVPSSAWEDYVVTNASLLPLDLYFYENQLYILHNVSDQTQLKEGSRLKSINGKPAMEIFNHMVDRWFKDGNNNTRPREIVEEEYRLLFTHFLGDAEKYDLEIVSPDGENFIFKVDGIQESEFKKRLKERFDIEFVPWWREKPEPHSFKIINGTAYLKVSQFNNGIKSEDGQRFAKFIKSSFKTIKDKDIDNLVLDLRGNQGGDVRPQLELLRHLVKEPFYLYKEVFANIRALPNPEYYEFNIISKTEFKKNFVNEKVNGVYPMKERPGFGGKPQYPSENLFRGNLYVLIDGWSFSATGEVCGIIKEHLKDAVFLGEETGGNPVTNVSGIQTFLTLPNSKNRILVCLVSYTTDVSYKNEGHGVIPNHWVRNTVMQEINNEDAVLEFTLKLIHPE